MALNKLIHSRELKTNPLNMQCLSARDGHHRPHKLSFLYVARD